MLLDIFFSVYFPFRSRSIILNCAEKREEGTLELKDLFKKNNNLVFSGKKALNNSHGKQSGVNMVPTVTQFSC